MRRILILSASFGEGHRQAANAIKEYFLANDPRLDIEVIDYIDSIHPTLNRLAKFVFIQSVKRFPNMYGYFYHQLDRVKPNSTLHKRIGIIGKRKLYLFLRRFQPQVVIHTFPTSAGVLSQLKREGKVNTPSVMVITDYATHSQWIQPDTDLYLVGSEEVSQQLRNEGVPKEKIAVTGIPVRQEFLRQHDRKKIKAELGLSADLPTVLIMGGAYGVSTQIIQFCEQLFQAKEDVQVIVICGRNRKMFEYISELSVNAKNKAIIYGFTDQVAKLMSVSDMMFTKSGGITTSEGIMMELPMIVCRPIPGQEMANAKFLKKAGAAIITRDMDEVELVISHLLNNPEYLQKMKENCRKLKEKIMIDSLSDAIEELIEYDQNGLNYHVLRD